MRLSSDMCWLPCLLSRQLHHRHTTKMNDSKIQTEADSDSSMDTNIFSQKIDYKEEGFSKESLRVITVGFDQIIYEVNIWIFYTTGWLNHQSSIDKPPFSAVIKQQDKRRATGSTDLSRRRKAWRGGGAACLDVPYSPALMLCLTSASHPWV